MRGSSHNLSNNILHDELSIDDLCADIKQKYFGKTFSDAYRNYQVKVVGNGTVESIRDRLRSRKQTKLIYLIAEETDG